MENFQALWFYQKIERERYSLLKAHNYYVSSKSDQLFPNKKRLCE